ncbi:hypothetical protein Tco_1058244 [Tanacetum coccineum]|uniref:Uncharacterized protein n=1 Tax=Tanacetum coccineum TaxID=301880 RepID=A0ABQ5H9J3_9ASTR
MAVGVDVRRDEDDGDRAVVTKRERDGGKGVMGSVGEEGDEGGVVACASTAGGGGRRGALAEKKIGVRNTPWRRRNTLVVCVWV